MVRKGELCSMLNYCEVSLLGFFPIPCGCGGIGIRARLRGVWLCLASSSLAIRITKVKGVRRNLLTLFTGNSQKYPNPL
jgi:hypothetical protein